MRRTDLQHMGMSFLNYKHWTWIALLVLAAATLANVLIEDDIRIVSIFVLPPLIAGLTTTPKRTAAVTACTIAAAFAVGAYYEELLDAGHTIRAAVIVIVSGLAVQTSILRERDLRTRRRLALINVARSELDAASGMEDDLISFARAAVVEFAEWAFLDIRVPNGPTSRFVKSMGENTGDRPVPRREVSSVAAAYEAGAQREGPLLLREVGKELLAALFSEGGNSIRHANVIIVPVSAGDLRATYFLVCPSPHPPWGEAELTQVESLARSAALKARSDQLIDKISFAQQELRESRDEVAAIVQGIADGVTAQSISGEMVYANEKAAEMFGFESAEELIGTHFGDVHTRMELRDEHGDPFDPMQLPSKRAFAGEEAPTALLRYSVKATGREWWTLVKSTAVRDAQGIPILAITVIEDLTEHRREELAQKFLADASKSLSESLDYESALQSIARAAVPAMADWCTIEMLGQNSAIETVAVAHADESREAEVRVFRETFPFGEETFGPPQVIRTGTAELYEQLDPERFKEIYSGDEARRSAALALSARSSLVAPIVVRGEPIGAISMVLTRPGVRFTDFDLETAIELGRRAGVTLDNARLHTERMRMLASLQKSLIPAKLPDLPGLQLSARFRPAEVDSDVGGDFYDAFGLPDGSSALIIGDVCGKGPEAAAITALARYTIRAAAMSETDPQAILAKLNDALLDQVGDGRFCTVAFARVIDEPGGGRSVETVAAGHPLPVLLGAGLPQHLGETGTLLGVVESPTLPVERRELPDDAAIVLYTDGLSAGQTTDDARFAAELMRDIRVNGQPDLAARIDTAALRIQLEPNRDDVAILVARSS